MPALLQFAADPKAGMSHTDWKRMFATAELICALNKELLTVCKQLYFIYIYIFLYLHHIFYTHDYTTLARTRIRTHHTCTFTHIDWKRMFALFYINSTYSTLLVNPTLII